MKATSNGPSVRPVHYGDQEFLAVREGLASILYPPAQEAASKGTRKDLKTGDEMQTVFYNPIQQFNRDLSVLAIKAFANHRRAERRAKEEAKKRKFDGNEPNKKKRRKCGGKEEKGENDNGKKHEQEQTDDCHGQRQQEQEPEQGQVVAQENRHVHTVGDGDSPTTTATTTAAATITASTKQRKRPPSFTILDALSATGLRALRYASEVPNSPLVVANDISPSAVQSMKMNIEYNGLQDAVQPKVGDARSYMYSLVDPARRNIDDVFTGKFDVIDLDPYGTAAPFMDASVQALKDGGLLCVTCTDAGVWASNGYPEKCFALYGGVPVRATYSHETGLRLILHALALSASRYGLAVEPLLSLSIDFYARIFVRVHRSQAEVKFLSGNTIMVYNCDQGCGAWATQPLTQARQRLDKKGDPFFTYSFAQGPVVGPTCQHCSSKTHIAGPMWGGPLHNPHFIRNILDMLPAADRDTYQTIDRIEGMLTTALEEDLDLATANLPSSQEENSGDQPTAYRSEHENDCGDAIIPRLDPSLREKHPFYLNLSALSRVVHTQTMQMDAFRGALCHLGYRSARSHAKPNTVRTDAPWDVIWEIMREWIRQRSPLKSSAIRLGTPAAAIMAKSRESGDRDRSVDQGASSEDQSLSMLKNGLLSAINSGKDVDDLATKVEAVLYRSEGARRVSKSEASKSIATAGTASNDEAGDGELERNQQSSSPTKKGIPHPSTLNIVFDDALGREVSKANTKKRLVRYQVNPRANWGPLNRAAGDQTT